MSIGFIEYNDTISLKERDIPKILNNAEQGNYEYFMQLGLQGCGLWLGFKEPFHASRDMLHALYYKIQTRKGGCIYACLGLWRNQPSSNDLYAALMSINKSVDAVINSEEISEFMSMGETQHLALRHPVYRRLEDDMPTYIVSR